MEIANSASCLHRSNVDACCGPVAISFLFGQVAPDLSPGFLLSPNSQPLWHNQSSWGPWKAGLGNLPGHSPRGAVGSRDGAWYVAARQSCS